MHDDEPPNENSAQHWINFNAFTARLLDAGLAKWTNFAVWALRDALEEPTLAKPIMNCRVAVAAEWVLQSGEAFFRCISEEVDKDEARSTKPGALYLGKEGLCNERWGFWKKRLLEVSKQVDTNIEERAIRAVEKMEKIEQSNI